MKLTEKDYDKMYSKMNPEGGYVEYEKDGETLCFDYDVETEGYDEDDYHCGYGNGTGAFVITSADVNIHDVDCYNEEGDDVDCDFDESKLEDRLEYDLVY